MSSAVFNCFRLLTIVVLVSTVTILMISSPYTLRIQLRVKWNSTLLRFMSGAHGQLHALYKSRYSAHGPANAFEPSSQTTYILAWTKFFSGNISGWRNLNRCPQSRCQLTIDRSLINESLAVIFHVRDIDWNDLPPVRHEWQYYVFFNFESPQNTYFDLSSAKLMAFFNLTMTYRLDSDVRSQYGYMIRLRNSNRSTESEVRQIAKNKTKLVAWFASNCNTNSRREAYVKQLQRYIPVDTYGQCGTMQCPIDSVECDKMLTKDYKFYLSFENSLCKDYVTEKFYERIKLNVVPIVLERSIYAKIAPHDSFIAADDFPSARHLAGYLRHLNQHHKEYVKYFKWRTTHYVTNNKTEITDMCKLCDMIIEYRKLGVRKIVGNLGEWWHKYASCHSLPERLLRS